MNKDDDYMEDYKILFCDNGICIVALNTLYDIGLVMKKFIKTENYRNKFDGIIIFDALLSSTSFNDRNRFFCFESLNGNVDFSLILNNYEVSYFVKEVCNNYFCENKNLLKNSLLLDYDYL